MIINKSFKSLVNMVSEQFEKQRKADTWGGKSFEKISKLKNDYSGKVGERWVQEQCKTFNIPHVYDEDIIDSDATYDIVINNKKVEIKTARVGINKNFQHESLRATGCDKYVFVDVVEDKFYVSIFDSKFDYTKRHPVFGRRPHLRKGTTDVYKFDFGLATIKKGIKAGCTLEINKSTKTKDVEKFLKSRL